MRMLHENVHILEGQRLDGSTDLHGKTMQQKAQNNGHLHDADICRQEYRSEPPEIEVLDFCNLMSHRSRLLKTSVHLTTEGPASVELIQFF